MLFRAVLFKCRGASSSSRIGPLAKWSVRNPSQSPNNFVAQFRSSSTSASSSSATSGAVVTKKKFSRESLSRLIKLWYPERGRMTAAIALLLVSSGVTMSVPFALGKIIDIIYQIDQTEKSSIDDAASSEDFEETLKTVCLGLTGVFLVGGLCNFGRVFLMRVAGQRITTNLRQELYSSLMRQRVPFFDKNKTGELVNRLSADSQLISQTLTQNVSDGLRSSVMTTAGVGMMFYMSPELAVVGLSIVPPVAMWAVWMGKKVRKASKEVQNRLADATQVAEEKLSNIRTVHGFAKQSLESQVYQSKLQDVLSVSAREALVHAKFYGMTGLSGNMIILSVLYYGGNLVTSGTLTVGELSSFVLYAAYVGIGFSGVSTFYAELMKGIGAGSRIWEIIDNSPNKAIESGKISARTIDLSTDIVFRGVDFRYETRPDAKILNSLSLCIPGKKISAIVGRSGSGKSTIAALLMKLYDCDSGQIFIGDHNIRDLNSNSVRQKMGIVAQEPILFSCSIRENILYGAAKSQSLTEADMIAAAKEANAHEFITELPEGYDTLVGERGVLLSGGQKQRVAIARAIIKNPEILILDEATSALDSTNEAQVKEALDRVMSGRTVVVIAHRLSTIKNADKIIVLKDGRVCEEGTYQELSSTPDGYFADFFKQQHSVS